MPIKPDILLLTHPTAFPVPRPAANVIIKNFPVPRAIRQTISPLIIAAQQGAPAGLLLPTVTQGKRNAASVRPRIVCLVIRRHIPMSANAAVKAAKAGAGKSHRNMPEIRFAANVANYPVIRLMLRG